LRRRQFSFEKIEINQHVGADVEKHWLGALINDWRNAADEGERGAPDLVPRPYPAQSERDMQGRSSARKAHHIRDSYYRGQSFFERRERRSDRRDPIRGENITDQFEFLAAPMRRRLKQSIA
jgi:hypothetical protein